MDSIKKVVVFGGTGAQGSAVVQALAKDGRYTVRVQTRNPQHSAAAKLALLPSVSFDIGDVESEANLRKAMQGMDAVFFLANGFAIGEKAEIFWSMRAFEIAHECGIKFFQYSGLDYGLKRGGYDPKFRCAHLDGKGRVAEWIQHQSVSPMKWAILTSGPYMEMMHLLWRPKLTPETASQTQSAAQAPTKKEKESETQAQTYVFEAPLGNGAIPMIHLDDLGQYARWIFDHPEQSAGMELKVATQHVHLAEMAAAFERVTGKKAVYVDVPLPEWLEGYFKERAGMPAAHQADAKETDQLTWRESFTGWWKVFQNSGGEQPVIARDYDLLDKILPSRVRSIEEWMRKVNYTGDEPADVLKDRADHNM